MWKYLAVGGILVVGFGVGFFARQLGEPAGGPTPSTNETDAEEATVLPRLSVTAPERTLETPKPAAPEPEVVQEQTKSTADMLDEELLTAIREAEPEQRAKARDELVKRYREAGKERKALTIELEGATGDARVSIFKKTEVLNEKLEATQNRTELGKIYKVQRGDTLTRIGTHYKISANYIRKLNGIKGDMILIGQKLKVVQGPFNVMVDKSDFRLTVFLGDQVYREYPIGLGVDGSTPVGEFVVQGKLKEPTWWHDGASYDYGDPHNPLGTRWITIQSDYGIHGTWAEDSIGQEKSHGCVRMLNKNVEALFELLVANHSKIAIRE